MSGAFLPNTPKPPGLSHKELEARGIVERRERLLYRDVDGDHVEQYARDNRGCKWKWDPTKGRWRRTRSWPESEEEHSMKTKKADRVNDFIMQGAPNRAEAKVRAYLSKNSLGLSSASLDEKNFRASMDAVVKAMLQMYSDAMCDTLDVVEGRPLEEIK